MPRGARASGTLSERQQSILEFISSFVDANSRPPTVREIGEGTGIGSTSVVDYNLRVLQKANAIRRDSRVSRGIEVVRRVSTETAGRLVRVPISGRIAAGEPVEALMGHTETIDLPAELASAQAFALRVKGKSMIDDLIDDGDLVVIRPQQTAENGDIVVAVVGNGPTGEDSVTLKRFYRERDRIRLQPANQAMEPIFVQADSIRIQGKVMSVIRNMA